MGHHFRALRLPENTRPLESKSNGRHVDVRNPFANAIVGGWQAGFVWTVQTLFPQTVTVGGIDRSGAGGLFDRPNATGASPYVDNPIPSRWFDRAAFVLQPAGTFGNVGRNSVVGPGFFTTTFTLSTGISKSTSIG